MQITLILVYIHWCPVITSVQELINNCFYISLCRSARYAWRILQREDILHNDNMQELNVVMLCSHFCTSQFLLASVFTPVQCLSGILLQETNAWWECLVMRMIWFLLSGESLGTRLHTRLVSAWICIQEYNKSCEKGPWVRRNESQSLPTLYLRNQVPKQQTSF